MAQNNLYRVSNISGIKLREVPASNGQYVVYIPENESVVLLAKLQGDWCKVRYNGKVGFTLYENLKKVEVQAENKADSTSSQAPLKENPKKDNEGRLRKNKRHT